MPEKHDPNNKNQIQLTIVVGGTPTTVAANINAPLQTVIPKALQQTSNVGQPPENWELKDANGNLLDLSKKIEEFSFTADIKLFLNLKAGAAGATR